MTTIDHPEDLPVLPYGSGRTASSGHSGGDTSRERAEQADSDGTTAARQRLVLEYLHLKRSNGATWREFSRYASLHHGQASGVLSNLHKTGRVARLTERRDRCYVYVLPEFVIGRETQEQGRKAKLSDDDRRDIQRSVRTLEEGWTPTRVHLLQMIQIVENLSGETFLQRKDR